MFWALEVIRLCLSWAETVAKGRTARGGEVTRCVWFVGPKGEGPLMGGRIWGVRRDDGVLDWYRLLSLGVITEESIVCWNGIGLILGGLVGWLVL